MLNIVYLAILHYIVFYSIILQQIYAYRER